MGCGLLQIGKLTVFRRMIGEFVVGKSRSRHNIGSHELGNSFRYVAQIDGNRSAL